MLSYKMMNHREKSFDEIGSQLTAFGDFLPKFYLVYNFNLLKFEAVTVEKTQKLTIKIKKKFSSYHM